MSRQLSILHRISAPGQKLCGVAWDGSHLWHADAGTNLLYCLAPKDGRVLRALDCPDVRACTSYAHGLLWQVAGKPKELRAVDAGTGDVFSALPLGSETACGVEVLDEHFWTTREEGALLLCRLADGSVEREFAAEPRSAGIAVVNGEVWYTVDTPGLLVRIEAVTGHELERFDFPGTPTGLGWDGARLWCADHATRTLVALAVPGRERVQ